MIISQIFAKNSFSLTAWVLPIERIFGPTGYKARPDDNGE